MKEMVERVAKAVGDEMSAAGFDVDGRVNRIVAAGAISAMRDATEGMAGAGGRVMSRDRGEAIRVTTEVAVSVWRDMIDEALK